MDLQFFDSEEIPVPREEVRLRGLVVRPFADGRRVRVEVEVTPFQERPNLELALLDPAGETISRSTIIQADSPRLAVTMHLRAEPAEGEYRVRGSLSYESASPQDSREESFSLAVPDGDGEADA